MISNRFSIHINSKNDDLLISVAIVVILYYALFNGAIFSVFEYYGLPGKNLVDVGLFLMEGAVILYGLLIATKRRTIFAFVSYLIVIIVYFTTSIIYSENKLILEGTIKDMFVFCLPICICAASLKNYLYLWNLLARYAPVIVICGIIYARFGAETIYSMWLGYCLLIPILLCIWKVLNKNARIIDFIILGVALFVLLTAGSRGPFLIIGVYSIASYFVYCCKSHDKILEKCEMLGQVYNKNKYNIHNLMILLSLLMIGVCCLVNIQELATVLYEFFLGMGYDSRILKVFAMDNGLFYSSGRNDIAKISFQLMLERPILGYGIGGDCIHIGKALGFSGGELSGWYAHNFILEILLHWGILVGGVLLIVFIILVFRKYQTVLLNSYEGYILVLITIYGVIYSMLSGTYLKSHVMWLFLGLLLNNLANSDNKLKY